MNTEKLFSSSREDIRIWADKNNFELTDLELEIAQRLGAIIRETELPRVDMPRITSTHNNSVVAKLDALREIDQLRGMLIPETLGGDDVLGVLSEEVLRTEPWVNMVHAWAKVMNVMNMVAIIQQDIRESEDGIIIDSDLLKSIITQLSLITLEGSADGDPSLRTQRSLDNVGAYAETQMRRSGVKGVNPRRLISEPELFYILDTINLAFVSGYAFEQS